MKTKKNITIYVDWGEQTIYTESELNDAKDERVNEMYDDERAFNDYLDKNYVASQICGMDYDDLRSEWRECCEARVDEEWENLEEISFEVDVDINRRDCLC